jgi:syntaxin 16
MQLAQRLKDVAFKLRRREKKHFLKIQELSDEQGFRTQRERDSFMNDEVVEEEDTTQRRRNKEIKTLVSTINDLAVLFKELSVLVVEQGTILDRIDYNIECAHADTKQAVVHLEKTAELEQSMRSKGALTCLISSIIVCLLLLVIKHT